MGPSPDPPGALLATPEPPYYAVVFTSLRRTPDEGDGYAETATELERLAAEQPGFLGIESSRGADGLGITVSYGPSLQAIAEWRDHAEHRVAQREGRVRWYRGYALRICRVERAYSFGGS